MYKQLIALHLACGILAYAAGNFWTERIQLAAELDRTGRFTEAGALYAQIVDEARTLTPTDARRSEAFNNAATHAYYTGDYTKAVSLYEQAVQAFQEAGEKNDAKLASMLANTAGVYRAVGRYEQARTSALRAVEVNPVSATCWNALAEVYRATGDLELGERAARKALEVVAPDQRDAKSQTLAAILSDRGQFKEALELYDRTLNYQAERRSVTAATTLANIAVVHIRRADYAQADAALTRALEIWQSAGVRATTQMAAAINNLAQVRKLQARYVEAEPLYRRALAIWETCVGKNHPEYAKGLSNMADFYHAIGNDRAAEDLYRRAAEILSATLGRENTVTSAVTSRRVEMLDALGRHTDARRVAMSFQ